MKKIVYLLLHLLRAKNVNPSRGSSFLFLLKQTPIIFFSSYALTVENLFRLLMSTYVIEFD
jgi:hypothetical protein